MSSLTLELPNPSKVRIEINEAMLSFLSPLLDAIVPEIFIDWFHDTPDKELARRGVRLRKRQWFPLYPPKEDRWSFHPKGTERTELCHLCPALLPGRFHHIYSDVFTKRYHLRDGLYVDFVGECPSGKEKIIYAVCTAKSKEILRQIPCLSTENTDVESSAKSKNAVMMEYHITGVPPMSISQEQFQKFDHYLDAASWDDFPFSEDSEEENDNLSS